MGVSGGRLVSGLVGAGCRVCENEFYRSLCGTVSWRTTYQRQLV